MARTRSPGRLDDILDAGMQVFARQGLQGTKMSDIAAKAGVSQGTLYNYVESKEALFRLLLDRGLGATLDSEGPFPIETPSPRALARRMETAIEDNFSLPQLEAALRRRRPSDAAVELTGVLEELFDRTYLTRRGADVLEAAARERPELGAVFYDKVRRGLLEKMAQLIARRAAGGFYEPREPAILARLLLEALTTFARHLHRDVEPAAFDVAAARQVVVETLVAGVVRSRRGKPMTEKARGHRSV